MVISSTNATKNDSPPADTNAANEDEKKNIDPVTALQDSIDLFSLSIFESLRQLRDTVSATNRIGNPRKTNKATSGDDDEEEEDDEEDEDDLQGDNASSAFPSEMSYQERQQIRDAILVQRLSTDILQKSHSIIHRATTTIPGMHRTKSQQYEYMQQLLNENTKVIQELQDTQQEAIKIRDLIRKELQRVTTSALGIEQEL